MEVASEDVQYARKTDPPFENCDRFRRKRGKVKGLGWLCRWVWVLQRPGVSGRGASSLQRAPPPSEAWWRAWSVGQTSWPVWTLVSSSASAWERASVQVYQRSRAGRRPRHWWSTPPSLATGNRQSFRTEIRFRHRPHRQSAKLGLRNAFFRLRRDYE